VGFMNRRDKKLYTTGEFAKKFNIKFKIAAKIPV